VTAREFVTLRLNDQLFAIDASAVHDVFQPLGVTPVPLAGGEIAGVLNLRGRIVTAVCARRRLGLPAAADETETIAVGLEIGGDSYGLIVDSVEELRVIDTDELLPPPRGLPPRWADVVQGVCRLETELLIVLDTQRLLDPTALAAA
jgi:purine-binding chemotaxis protein CheW